ncbi:MAG: SpoIIE family protein phosphatase [Armatimonadetes bacterium]|nr:SpoIIE family protein phosphatase [Armatimonadota bacterium]
MRSNLSIKQRLSMGFGGVLILMAVVVAMIGSQLNTTRRLAETTTSSLVPQVKAANNLALATDIYRIGLRAFITTWDNSNRQPYTSALEEQKTLMRELRSRLTDAPERRIMDKIDLRIEEMGHHEAHILALLNAGRKKAALAEHDRFGRHISMEVNGSADQLASLALEHISMAAHDYDHTVARLNLLAKSTFVAALVLTLLFVGATVRSVSRPASEISRAAGAVAKGDYAVATQLAAKCGVGPGKSNATRPRSELGQIAVALAAMAESLESRERRLEGHRDISSVCASTIDLMTLLDTAASQLARHTGSHVAAIYICSGDKLKATGTFGISPEEAEKSLTGPNGLAEQAARSGEPIVLSDIPHDTKFIVRPGLGNIIPRAIACIPMQVEGRPIGAAVLGSLRGYDKATIAFLQSAATEIGIAASNALRHLDVQNLAHDLQEMNEQLDAQNEELQAQNEEIQAQNEEIQTQNEELAAQSSELQQQNAELEVTSAELRAAEEQQRRLAETLQKSFLPRPNTCIVGHDIADAYVPAHEHSQVGGDFYDIINLEDGKVGLVIADVSGKGVDAAVYTAMAKYMLRGFALEESGPARVLWRLNEAITRCDAEEVFITLFYGVLDTCERKLIYASAGHEPPLIFQRESGACMALQTTGPVLGILRNVEYSQEEVSLPEHDVLIMYTDGIVEAGRGRERLGHQRLEEIICRSAALSAKDIAHTIVTDTRKFADGRLGDDVALLVVKPTDGEQPQLVIGEGNGSEHTKT